MPMRHATTTTPHPGNTQAMLTLILAFLKRHASQSTKQCLSLFTSSGMKPPSTANQKACSGLEVTATSAHRMGQPGTGTGSEIMVEHSRLHEGHEIQGETEKMSLKEGGGGGMSRILDRTQSLSMHVHNKSKIVSKHYKKMCQRESRHKR